MLSRLPLPQCFWPRGRKLRPWSEQNSDQNSDHPRHCIYQAKEKLRPWSEFLGREISDHGLSLACFWGRGRRGGSQKGGVLAKGVSVESSATVKEAKVPPKYWAQQYIWHSERHSQERHTFLQKSPSRNPLFLDPDGCANFMGAWKMCVLSARKPPCP